MFVEAKYQTFWQRFWAGLIDGIVLIPIGVLNWVVLSPGRPKWIVLTWGVIFYASYPLYSILMHGRYGRTIGKRIMGVVVLDASEQRLPTYRQAFMRDIVLVISQGILLANFVRVVFEFGYLRHTDRYMGQFGYVFEWASEIWFWLEVITMLTNRKRRALHDWLAGTVAVDEGAVPVQVVERLS